MNEQSTSLVSLCKRCSHMWWQRSQQRPRQCPKCKSQHWDKEKTQAYAQYQVKKAVEQGLLAKLDGSIKCSDCEKPAVVYDHRDYDEPLKVRPVCNTCNVKRGPTGPKSLAAKLTNPEVDALKEHAYSLKLSLVDFVTNLLSGVAQMDRETVRKLFHPPT